MIEKTSEDGGERKIEEREEKAKRRGERGVNSRWQPAKYHGNH